MTARTRGRQRVSFDVVGFGAPRPQRSPVYRTHEYERAVNFVPEALDRPGRLLLRQGFKRLKQDAGTSALGLNAAGNIWQASCFCPFASGAQYVVWSNGELWAIDLTAFTSGRVLTTAQLTAAAIDATNVAGMAFYNGKLVVGCSGSANKAWTWSGAVGAGITKIANSPNGCFGPVVYAGKLFFMVSAGGGRLAQQIAWSEEADETIGYGTAPYIDNIWTLLQTSRNYLVNLAATNGALYAFRQRDGILALRGEVNSNFRTSATRDDVSLTVGSDVWGFFSQPYVTGDGVVLFCDDARRPCVIRDGRVVDVWRQLPHVFSLGTVGASGAEGDPYVFKLAPGTTSLWASTGGAYFAGYHRQYGLNFIAMPSGSTMWVLLLDPQTDRIVAEWTMACGSNLAGFDYSSGLGGALGYCIMANGTSGALFVQDPYGTITSQGTQFNFNDETAATAGSPVTGTLIGPPHGWDCERELDFESAAIVVEARGNHLVRFGYVTSAQHKGALTPADQTFTENPASTPFERHVEIGLFTGPCRWLRPQIQVSAQAGLFEQPGLYGYRLKAFADANDAKGY